MDIQIRPMLADDAQEASRMDEKWFGKYGISTAELSETISNQPENTLALTEGNHLLGFAIFEIIESGMPKDYVGNTTSSGKVLFIQQFTTLTNYKTENNEYDTLLIDAVEKKAKKLDCHEVWEALAKDHPYHNGNNIEFDAFGFYEKHGYIADYTQPLTWQPGRDISIPCYVFRKYL